MANDDGQVAQFAKFFLTTIELVEPQYRSNLPDYLESIEKGFIIPRKRVEYKGYSFYPWVEPKTVEYAFNNLEWKSSDVLVAAYSKTGTTWVSAIVKHILGRKDPELLKKYLDITQFFAYLEFGPVSKYEVVENLPLERRFLATHLPASFVNLDKLHNKGVKIVCVLRNPKDQAVSWYNFAMSLPISKSEHWKDLVPEDEKKFYDIYIAGKQSGGVKNGEDYLESVRQWYQIKNMDNVHFVMYEEIKKDPRSEIRKLAEFLGEPLNEKEMNWIMEKTAFSFMKKESESGIEKSGMIKMFRKGQVGDWKNHLTVAQSELIDQRVKEVLGDTDIEFIYE